MARSRRNDPIGLTDEPVCVSDPRRRAARIAEFRRGLAYIDGHYRLGKRFFGSVTEFNDAAHALNALAAGEYAASGSRRRLPPMIEIAVSVNARRFAEERRGQPDAAVEGQDIRRAAEHVGKHLHSISHRPRAHNLIHHVRGLMVLLQDFSGRPVVPRRYRNSVYDPHFMPGVSQVVPLIFGELEPTATIGQLVNIAEDARKDWAGRRPKFSEHFPAYGLRSGPDGSLISPSGAVIARFEPNIPTYFH